MSEAIYLIMAVLLPIGTPSTSSTTDNVERVEEIIPTYRRIKTAGEIAETPSISCGQCSTNDHDGTPRVPESSCRPGSAVTDRRTRKPPFASAEFVFVSFRERR